MNPRKCFSYLFLLLFSVSTAIAADTYEIDPAHSSVGFSIRHLVISNVKGQFNKFSGSLTHDASAAPPVTAVSAVIDAASIDTAIAKRDEHLRSADFFDTAKHPEIKFEAKKFSKDGDKNIAHGSLTIHGVTKEIELPFVINGPIKDMGGKDRIGIEATTKINRKDYGLTWSKTLESGGVVVGDEVTIEIQAEYVKK